MQSSESSSAAVRRLQHAYKHAGSSYGIEWRCRGHVLYPQEMYGNCAYLDESNIARFSCGEGLVGKAWQQKGTIFLPSVRDASNEFLRKRSAVDDGIQSIVFTWCEGSVFEFGFPSMISQLPDFDLTDGQVPCFTPAAHRNAFLSRAYSHPDMRSKQQMPDFQPPSDRVFFSMDDVRRHTSKDDAWVVIHGNVYNVTNFLKYHPGWTVGSQSATILSILRNLGKDCTLEFDLIHPDYAVRQLADYRIGEVHLEQGASEARADATFQAPVPETDDVWTQSRDNDTLPAPPATLMEFMSGSSGLTAAYIGGTALAQLCMAASGLRDALQDDPESLRVLESRACLTTHPSETPWGLSSSLDSIGSNGVQFHEDPALGACVIGKSGLRRGLASCRFFVQDFTGVLLGVTTCTPDSGNAMEQVLDTQASTLFTADGDLFSSKDKIYGPFTRSQDLALVRNVNVNIDMNMGRISCVVTSCSGQIYNNIEAMRPEWRPQSGHALFPVIFSTHLSLSQFETGSATCTVVPL